LDRRHGSAAEVLAIAWQVYFEFFAQATLLGM
jgi:hypothetical protein